MLSGATAFLWPDTAFLGTFGRILDSLAPQILVLGVVLSAALAPLGAARLGLVLLCVAAAGAVGVAIRHAAVVAPAPGAVAGPGAGLDVIWYNVLFETGAGAEDIADALRDSGADLIVLSEAESLRPALPGLIGRYPYQMGCTKRRCEILVLSRHPFVAESADMQDMSRPERLAQFSLDVGPDVLHVVAVHMSKPWFFGYHEPDTWFLLRALEQAGPDTLVLGDFNAAPWSRPMLALFRDTGLTPPRRPVATWPARLGPLAVPIDHMLVRGRPTLEGPRPWTPGLGSNHRGLRARVWP